MRAFSIGLISLAIFLASCGLSIGLTYLPCYSAICVEKRFPYSTRLHIATFYACVAFYLSVFILRRFSPNVRASLDSLVSSRPIPWTPIRISLGGFLVAIGVIGFTTACQGFWWDPELQWYGNRGVAEAGTTLGTTRLALVGTTGHVCDILLGLVVIPVSRDGVLGCVLGFEVGTLQRFHTLVGYLLFAAVTIHTIIFYTWVPVFAHGGALIKETFYIDNPTMRMAEVEANYYYATVLASGMVSWAIFIAIIVSSLPKLRRRSYNAFYYIHLLSVLFFVLVCIHASTDFYMLLPGLTLWIVDWALRLKGLSIKVDARLQKEQNGWFRLVVSTSDLPKATLKRLEETADLPLKHFYLNVPQISRWQNHPFTTASGVASNAVTRNPEIVWLFRVSNIARREKKQRKEWTVKLAALLDRTYNGDDIESYSAGAEGITLEQQPTAVRTRHIKMRIEGPYASSHSPFTSAHSILCIVGGTGITGALSLAERFVRIKTSPDSSEYTCQNLSVVWSIRNTEDAPLTDIASLQTKAVEAGVDLPFRRHVTGSGRARMDFGKAIREWVVQTGVVVDGKKGGGKLWVYFSGPQGFMNAGEASCVALTNELQPGGTFEWYSAKWEV